MTTLDNSTVSSAAASEPPAAPLDGIELQAEGAAQHLPNGSPEAAAEHLPNGSPEAAAEQLPEASAEPASEHLPMLQWKFRPQPPRQIRSCRRPPLAKKRRRQNRFWTLPLNSLRKNNGGARLSQDKAVIQTAVPRERATMLRVPSRR